MSAPSFSSFPAPTFSSFPDLEEPKEKKKEKLLGRHPSKDKDRDRRDKKSRRVEREESSRHDERERSEHRDKRDRDKGKDTDRPSKSGRTKEKKAEKAYRDEKRRERKGKDKERERRKDKRKQPASDEDTGSDLEQPAGEAYDFERDLESARKQRRAVNEADHSVLDLSNLCITDRKGDPGNVQYGSLHRADVPRFFRAGYGNVLGAPPGWKIVGRGVSKTVEIGKRGRPAAKRYVDKRAISSTTRRLIPSKTPLPLTQEEEEGYIRITKRRTQNKDDLGDEMDESGKIRRREDGPAYRSITRTDRDSSASSSSSSESESDTELITPELTRAGQLTAR
ncbi:hypothetical protein FRC09_020093, partial [Ceratobasidium sp. 395]